MHPVGDGKPHSPIPTHHPRYTGTVATSTVNSLTQAISATLPFAVTASGAQY